MKKVAVLYIATGKYVRLWPGFLESAEKYLLKSCEVEYFVFTEHPPDFSGTHALAVHDIAAV